MRSTLYKKTPMIIFTKPCCIVQVLSYALYSSFLVPNGRFILVIHELEAKLLVNLQLSLIAASVMRLKKNSNKG